MIKSIIATIQPGGQNGPTKWFVQLFPQDVYEAKAASYLPPVAFYVSADNKIYDIRVCNVATDKLEWFQNALEFLKIFSAP